MHSAERRSDIRCSLVRLLALHPTLSSSIPFLNLFFIHSEFPVYFYIEVSEVPMKKAQLTGLLCGRNSIVVANP